MAESRLSDFKRLFREVSPCLHVHDIGQHLGIARQSVYRLRDRLRDDEGVWLEEHTFNPEVPKGCLRWPQDQPFDENVLISLTTAEVEALKTAAERMEGVTPLVSRALHKLAQGKPLERALSTDPILYTPLADSYPDGLFERVAKTIRERRVVEVTYLNAKGEENTYRFNPYVLVPSSYHLHLIGMSHPALEAGSDRPIPLRLDQVKAYRQTNAYFAKPDFDIAAYAAGRFGPFSGEGDPATVRVRFSAEKAQYIRRSLRHVTQEIEDVGDGGVVWSIRVPLSQSLVHWISSYGRHARVLEPEALREEVKAWAQGSVEANS